jgi:hypothetical protein
MPANQAQRHPKCPDARLAIHRLPAPFTRPGREVGRMKLDWRDTSPALADPEPEVASEPPSVVVPCVKGSQPRVVADDYRGEYEHAPLSRVVHIGQQHDVGI